MCGALQANAGLHNRTLVITRGSKCGLSVVVPKVGCIGAGSLYTFSFKGF